MKVFDGVKKGISRSIVSLTRIFGVECDVYFPVKYNNNQHGFKDDNIEYREDSDFNGKLLIPAVFKSKQDNYNNFLDSFTDGDTMCYATLDNEFPKYSKIITQMESGLLSYTIDNIYSIQDDTGKMFYKYVLIPNNKIDLSNNIDGIEEVLEIEDDLIDDEFQLKEDVTNSSVVQNNDILYRPIK